MAAIDKIYLNNFEDYILFKNWCEKQPKLKDKYGVEVSITDYLYKYKDEFIGEHVVFQAPYYIDAYLIRNCPFDFIQKEMMLNYGHWSQDKINEAYDIVKKRTEGQESPFYEWLTIDDFKIVDGIITMPNKEKSDYELIRDGKMYNTPYTNSKYIVGKHFRCTKHPIHYYNKPFKCKKWFIQIDVPDGMNYMWYHSNHNSWDFSDEFVKCKWSSSTAFCSTIKSLKRLIPKWKLPIGTKISVRGRYVFDDYQFLIKK